MDMSNIVIKSYMAVLKGTVELPKELRAGRTYTCAGMFDCKTFEYKDNEDGTWNLIFKLLPTGEFIIKNEEGAKVAVKTKKSRSKQLRDMIWAKWKDSGEDDFDRYYDAEMLKIMDQYHFGE